MENKEIVIRGEWSIEPIEVYILIPGFDAVVFAVIKFYESVIESLSIYKRSGDCGFPAIFLLPFDMIPEEDLAKAMANEIRKEIDNEFLAYHFLLWLIEVLVPGSIDWFESILIRAMIITTFGAAEVVID